MPGKDRNKMSHQPSSDPRSGSPRPRRGCSSPIAIERAGREREAIILRTAGFSYDEIAERLGYRDASRVRKALEGGLSRWTREPDEELRALGLGGLDHMGQRLSRLMEDDDPEISMKAMDTYLRVMHLRARITGPCDVKPQRHEAVVTANQTPRPAVIDRVKRFMVLTGQIIEENSGGVALDEVVEATSSLDDHDELEDPG